jgi:hypothetical protein
MRNNTIDEMISAISKGNGFAKTNLFFVMLPAQGSETARQLNLLCTSIALPSRQLSSVERIIGGDRRDIAYGFANPTVSMNFRVLNDQGVRQFFENWQNSIVTSRGDTEGDYDIAFPKEYVRPIHIYQLRKGVSFPIFNTNKQVNLGPFTVDLGADLDLEISGKSTYHWILEDAYPITFQNESLTDGADQISEITIEFSYRRWKGEILTEQSKVGITASGDILTNIAEKIGNKIYDILG